MTGYLCASTPIAIAVLGIGGCGHDTGIYKILRESRSPDGALLAQLVQRESHHALSSDTYFVVLSHDRLDEGSLRLSYHENKRPFLNVTNGGGLLLNWVGTKNLEVSCHDCGLRKIDVMTKRYEDNGVSISYMGFPSGTAYSDK